MIWALRHLREGPPSESPAILRSHADSGLLGTYGNLERARTLVAEQADGRGVPDAPQVPIPFGLLPSDQDRLTIQRRRPAGFALSRRALNHDQAPMFRRPGCAAS